MTRRLMIRQAGCVFNRTDRLYDINSAGALAESEFCLPDGPVQIWSEIDVGRVLLTRIPTISGLDQISQLQFRPSTVIEPLGWIWHDVRPSCVKRGCNNLAAADDAAPEHGQANMTAPN